VRRGGLVVAVATAVAAVLAAAGCHAGVDPTLSSGALPTATTTATATPVPVDPMVTIEVCGLATAATATTTSVFNEQIAAFEQAAARNDQSALVASSKAINDQFDNAAQAFTTLSKRPAASPDLQAVLAQIAQALTQMSSVDYTGTTVDIRKKLVDFQLALDSVCTTATATPTSSPG
jgi:hypothetical protein